MISKINYTSYRSNHEYEWASEFGDRATYEPRSFNVQGESVFGKTYRPDFYIKHLDLWIEVKAKRFNNQSYQIISQLIRANAAVRKYNLRLYLLAGLPRDYKAYHVTGHAFSSEHFSHLGLVESDLVLPNTSNEPQPARLDSDSLPPIA